MDLKPWLITAGALASCLLTMVVLAGSAVEGTPPAAWLEVTPQARDAEPRLYPATAPPAQAEDLASGLSMVCWGGPEAAVSCERLVLDEGAEIRREPAAGLAVTGVVFVGRFPAEEARISVVPHGLAFRRQFTVPLAWDAEAGELQRHVTTEAQGRFVLPPLAAGDWFLEIHLPGGRLERSEPFTLPERAARAETAETPPEPFDLGVLAFDAGLRLEIYVTDSNGLPVPGARVGASQGPRPSESDFFEVRADADGLAVISGLEPDEKMSIACTA